MGEFRGGMDPSLAGKRGGATRWGHKAPYLGTILDVMDVAELTGASWDAWRALWRAVFALPMSDTDLATFRRHTQRERPPSAPVKELWEAVGRRGGKSIMAAVAALFMAIRFDRTTLTRGESAVIPLIAADRRQARVVMGYLRGLCKLRPFRPYVGRELKERIEFKTGVAVEIHSASYRSTRGYTIAGVVCDEIAFWRSDESANPDTEILNALRPGMATVPGSLLLAISSPYAARGELYRAYQRSYGVDDDRVLVWNSDTRSMNPAVDAAVIEQAFEDDPVSAASEFGSDGHVQFRRDVEAFLDPEAVEAITVPGCRELPAQRGVKYYAFVDPSGGSQDSFTLAIAHSENNKAVLDCIREMRPPFSPDSVVADYVAVLRAYGCRTVTGDRYGGEWPRERFESRGIEYQPSEKTKSDIYREFLPLANAKRVELLDNRLLRAQLIGLERRVARGGRDSIDHQPGGRDDIANAAAGALVMAGPAAETGPRLIVSPPDPANRARLNAGSGSGSGSSVGVGRYW